MKRRDFISSHLGRNIGKARTTSSICGWALTSVRFDIRIQLSLIILSHPESTEDADDNEAMDLDDDQYPLLPEDVLEYRLRRRKAVLRQYMAAARRKYHSNPFYVAMDDNHNTGFHNINGRIPWTDIAENPSHHLAKKSRPELDFKLEEPSHMTSKGVDCWLRHWLKIQKKGEHPLVLRDPTAQPSKGVPNSAVVSKRKATRSKVWNIDSEEAEDRQTADALSDGGEAPAMPETTSDHASDRLGGASS